MTAVKTVRKVITAAEFDLGHHEGDIVVHNTHNGNKYFLRVKVGSKGDFAGKRMLDICNGDPRDWKNWRSFAFVNTQTQEGQPLKSPRVVLFKKDRGNAVLEGLANAVSGMLYWQTKGVEFEISIKVTPEPEPVPVEVETDDPPF